MDLASSDLRTTSYCKYRTPLRPHPSDSLTWLRPRSRLSSVARQPTPITSAEVTEAATLSLLGLGLANCGRPDGFDNDEPNGQQPPQYRREMRSAAFHEN